MLTMRVFLIIIIHSFIITNCVSHIVKVDEGELIGTTYTLHNGRTVHAFYGVPYAAPPIGDNRFKEAEPVASWLGTWNATYPRSNCIQYPHRLVVEGDEDCLYLNVFTPKLPTSSNNLMNVMVYFHGGAFMFGDGWKARPEYIMQKSDLVFVSIEYRVGAIGFFSTNDPIAPGNYGLKDQVAALQWVKRNIRNFGGNPNKVTLFGNSAGGASVHYHYFSPLSEGLFHNGISSSGSVLTPWARPKNMTEKSIRLASLLGCPTTNVASMVKCMREKPAMEIVKATKHFQMWKYCPFTVFGPVVEPPSPNAFLTENPIEMMENKRVKNLPWMNGVVEKEGLYPGAGIISNDAHLKELNDRWYEIAPNLLQYNFSVPELEKDNVSSLIKDFYFGNQTISRENANLLIEMLGDRLYYNDITYSVNLHSAATQSTNVYCYNFIYKGSVSPYTYYMAQNWENYGTGHGDDQFFILNEDALFISKTVEDAKIVDLMTSSFIAFMDSGNPNTDTTKWSPLKKGDAISCLGIYSADADVNKMEDIVGDSKRNEFWKKLIPSDYPETRIPASVFSGTQAINSEL